MIRIENTEVVGWEHAIRGMRNPMNSWSRSDSYYECEDGPCSECKHGDACLYWGKEYKIGPNDFDLMRRLAACGPVHAKYRRMITVYVDITAPLYFWKEADTYRMGVEKNSCSTMHKIHAKEFTLEDFSCEHLIKRDGDYWNWDIAAGPESVSAPLDILEITIDALNTYREKYIETKDKKYWYQMIQLLPNSYNQKRTVMMNYEVLTNIYHSRKDHKLDEWHDFCDWIKTLPYSELITGGNGNAS